MATIMFYRIDPLPVQRCLESMPYNDSCLDSFEWANSNSYFLSLLLHFSKLVPEVVTSG